MKISKRIIIIGAGGHAKVVAALALKCGYEILGFLEDNDISRNSFSGYSILGNVSEAIKWKENANFIVAIGSNPVRQQIAEEHNDLNWRVLIHPSAQISADVELGEGTVVFANAVINPGVKIGKHCIINTSSVVEHDNILEDYVHISPGAILCGTVSVGLRSHIGAGAVIKNNISISKDCVIGAGAIVVKKIEKPGTYVGNPAREM